MKTSKIAKRSLTVPKRYFIEHQASPLPHLVIAGYLAGFVVKDLPLVRKCEERYTEDAFRRSYQSNVYAFRQELAKQLPEPAASGPDVTVALIFSAECIFEQARSAPNDTSA